MRFGRRPTVYTNSCDVKLDWMRVPNICWVVVVFKIGMGTRVLGVGTEGIYRDSHCGRKGVLTGGI